MIDERFVYVGLVVSLLGSISYLVDTIKGKAKPNRVSFFVWALAPLIAFAAQLDQEVGLQSLLTFIVGFNPLMIFLASFLNKEAAWKITGFDLVCGALSIVGLILWQVTSIANLAILFGIVADGIAAIPTLRKSFTHPETENYLAYLGSGISAFITLLTIDRWTFETYSFSLYIFAICMILTVLIKFELGKRFLSKNI